MKTLWGCLAGVWCLTVHSMMLLVNQAKSSTCPVKQISGASQQIHCLSSATSISDHPPDVFPRNSSQRPEWSQHLGHCVVSLNLKTVQSRARTIALHLKQNKKTLKAIRPPCTLVKVRVVEMVVRFAFWSRLTLAHRVPCLAKICTTTLKCMTLNTTSTCVGNTFKRFSWNHTHTHEQHFRPSKSLLYSEKVQMFVANQNKM